MTYLCAKQYLGLPQDDLLQAERLARLEGRPRGCAYDQLARELGWRRIREADGSRRWVREEVALSRSLGYRHLGGARKRAAAARRKDRQK